MQTKDQRPTCTWYQPLFGAQRSKSVPLQAWTGPEGSRRLRLPAFMTKGDKKLVRLSALRTGRLYRQCCKCFSYVYCYWTYDNPHRKILNVFFIIMLLVIASRDCTSHKCKMIENRVFTHKIGHEFTLHSSEIFYWLRLLTIYHQLTFNNYLETVLWCKATFYLSDWTVFISIWRVGISDSCIVNSLKMMNCALKRAGVANQ